ncbi:hypothetical protein B6U98_02910 [Thermoplasmatales archaeon ex4572_165]|nr:MAG: hypothetical protein B6U98_02910 [Thermoplasmatales archaeon ex4572_165]
MNDERKKWVIETFHLTFPVVLGIGVVSFVGYVFVNDMQGKYWSFVSAYFFPPLGKETIIPAGILVGIHPLVMALSIAFVDFIVALFLIWNYDLAKNIPLIGTFMKKVESIGKTSSNKYSWIKPLRFIGIMLFVMIPFQGSGGMVGSIVGRLIGMKPWTTLISITLGAVIGCTLVAYFAESLKTILLQNLNAGLIIIASIFIIGIIIYLYRRNNKKKKQEFIQ